MSFRPGHFDAMSRGASSIRDARARERLVNAVCKSHVRVGRLDPKTLLGLQECVRAWFKIHGVIYHEAGGLFVLVLRKIDYTLDVSFRIDTKVRDTCRANETEYVFVNDLPRFFAWWDSAF